MHVAHHIKAISYVSFVLSVCGMKKSDLWQAEWYTKKLHIIWKKLFYYYYFLLLLKIYPLYSPNNGEYFHWNRKSALDRICFWICRIYQIMMLLCQMPRPSYFSQCSFYVQLLEQDLAEVHIGALLIQKRIKRLISKRLVVNVPQK